MREEQLYIVDSYPTQVIYHALTPDSCHSQWTSVRWLTITNYEPIFSKNLVQKFLFFQHFAAWKENRMTRWIKHKSCMQYFENKSVKLPITSCFINCQTFKSVCNAEETFHAFCTSLKSKTHWSLASLRACLSPRPSCFRSRISFSFSYNSLRASLAYKTMTNRMQNINKDAIILSFIIYRHHSIQYPHVILSFILCNL